MYSFIVEEVTGDGRILSQAVIFGHDEHDALARHSNMHPRNELMDKHKVTFRVFKHVQTVAVMSPSYGERMQSIAAQNPMEPMQEAQAK